MALTGLPKNPVYLENGAMFGAFDEIHRLAIITIISAITVVWLAIASGFGIAQRANLLARSIRFPDDQHDQVDGKSTSTDSA